MNRGVSILPLLCVSLALALLLLSDAPPARAEPLPPPAPGLESQLAGEAGLEAELPLPPGAFGYGYLPMPMDLSHLKGDRMPDGVSAAALPSRWDWRDQGMVTPVGDQNPCGACYAFAFLGAFESKLLRDGAGAFNLSENHAKECSWEELNGYSSGGAWGSCDGGNPQMMANLFSRKGTVQESCDPYVPADVGCTDSCPYQQTVLGWNLICGDVVPDVNVLKAYIYNYGPVHTKLNAGDVCPYGAWCQEFQNYDGSYTLYHPTGGTPNHGVLIVGWDDTLPHGGGTGAWIVKNSWGTGWGDAGYFTIAYGSANIGMESGFVSEWQNYDAGGGLLHYDEAGWWTDSIGWLGSKTDWGLVKFIPETSTRVTRVEFWSRDTTSDVDVYVYDSFDGVSLGNLLFARENLLFDEAGYHSVRVDPPVVVAAADDIIAVVKITNANVTAPLVVDKRGPVEQGRTYHSPSGANGSWQDVGSRSNADVAIRLRTSNLPPSATLTPTPSSTATRTPTPSPTFKPFTPTAWIYLPVLMKHYAPSMAPTATATLPAGNTPTPTLPAPGTPTPTPTATATQVLANTPTRTPTAVAGAVVVPLSGSPYSLAVNSGNGRLYVARRDASDVAVLDLATLDWVTSVSLDDGPQVVRVNPSLGRGYAAYGSPLYVFSCADSSLSGQISTSVYNAYELAIDSSNHRVYVGDWTTIVGRQDKVLVYDGTSNGLVGSVDLGSSPDIERIGMAVNRTTGLAYAAYTGDDKIAIIGSDLMLQGRITPSQISTYPWIVVNSVTNRLYLRGEDETVVIDLNSNSEVGTLSRAGLLAVDETRNRVYVMGTSKVYVYDGATNLIVRELAMDKYRYTTDIAVDPATHRVLLAAPNDDVIVSVQD